MFEILLSLKVGFEAQVNINDLEAKVKSHVVELETCLQQVCCRSNFLYQKLRKSISSGQLDCVPLATSISLPGSELLRQVSDKMKLTLL